MEITATSTLWSAQKTQNECPKFCIKLGTWPLVRTKLPSLTIKELMWPNWIHWRLIVEIWRAKKPPSFCWDCGSYLSCGTASTVTVSSWICVKGSRVLLGRLNHPFCYREIWGADVGSRQGPLIPGRLRAALSDHVTGLWPVVRVISVIKLLLKTSGALLEGITGNLEKHRSAAVVYEIKYYVRAE